MTSTDMAKTAQDLRKVLTSRADPRLAREAQRYFPHEIRALGVSNGEVMKIADAFLAANAAWPPEHRLALAEHLIAEGDQHEEVMLGFALIRKAVRRLPEEVLLGRFRHWLEHHVSNWAQCDDLCLKVIHPFFLTYPHLITTIRGWADSPSPWCRRAANVALVKLVHRRIGKSVYALPLDVVFGNALRLMDDSDPYVQKSVGWLLKAASQHHPDAVVCFVEANVARMRRDTLRYAIEKLGEPRRKALLALPHAHGGTRA